MAVTVLAALAVQVAHLPPPPSPAFEQALTVWKVGAVTCADGPAQPVSAPDPRPVSSYGRELGPGLPVPLDFRIDATGRPVTITGAPAGPAGYDADLMPALAAARFPPQARDGCRIAFTPDRRRFADAPLPAVVAYTVLPNGRAVEPAWDRLRADTPDCTPSPAALLRGAPDFDRLTAIPGRISWSMVRFDTDAGGRPRRVRVDDGSGNAALDRASLQPVQRSRFVRGQRRGCRYPYWRGPGVLAAPELTDLSALRPEGATCPLDHGPWRTMPPLRFPASWHRRAIEGWAVVAFDVAPWGQTGNVRVLRAEPAAAFGDAAAQIIRAATKAATAQGGTGCIDRVVFRMPPRPAQPNDDGPE